LAYALRKLPDFCCIGTCLEEVAYFKVLYRMCLEEMACYKVLFAMCLEKAAYFKVLQCHDSRGSGQLLGSTLAYALRKLPDFCSIGTCL
jgi:hypothetical protein